MKKRLKKAVKKKGFTLAELLVVVGIIGVLVAISIPIFSNQLEKAREATDAANIRSQYAEVLTDAIVDGGNVNQNHATYAPITLRQQVDRWQDTSLQANLEGVFGKVIGDYPKAKGQAWVEFDAMEQYAILYYEDAGGDSSGEGSSMDEPETSQSTTAAPPETVVPVTKPAQPETSSTESTEPETSQAPEESTESTEDSSKPSGTSPFGGQAYDWDRDIKTQSEYTVEPGKVYV